jgi:hypothetical protein
MVKNECDECNWWRRQWYAITTFTLPVMCGTKFFRMVPPVRIPAMAFGPSNFE